MRIVLLALMAGALYAQPAGKPLIQGRSLDNWEVRGESKWAVNSDGVLIGQRTPLRPWPAITSPEWRPFFYRQAWIYTKAEYENFDLSLEYWLPVGGNSGIALRDPSRAEGGIKSPPDFTKTPSKVAYEIQLNNQYPDDHRSGSIYGLAKAPDGLQKDSDWNKLEIEARADLSSHLSR
jgi:hypothetical protein